jgi:hypothetical protein
LEGTTTRVMAPLRRTRGEMNQKRARQDAFSTKTAARKGPRVLPRPTHDPRIPWYFPRSRNVT